MALAYDRTNGAIDRFHSLPIPRGAGARRPRRGEPRPSLLPIVLMSITGLIIGWRIHGGVARRARRLRPDVVFSFAVIWVGVLLGSVVATPEAVQGVAFVVIFPITFIASTFVPTSTLPGC